MVGRRLPWPGGLGRESAQPAAPLRSSRIEKPSLMHLDLTTLGRSPHFHVNRPPLACRLLSTVYTWGPGQTTSQSPGTWPGSQTQTRSCVQAPPTGWDLVPAALSWLPAAPTGFLSLDSGSPLLWLDPAPHPQEASAHTTPSAAHPHTLCSHCMGSFFPNPPCKW